MVLAAPLYKVWQDQPVQPLVFVSAQTIKCDAARAAFAAAGRDIVWAVADTGIDGAHPHFKTHKTLGPRNGLKHRDFTDVFDTDEQAAEAALVDDVGHGTHVAGIIAGQTIPTSARKIKIRQAVRPTTRSTTSPIDEDHEDSILGLAPYCKIMSLKVLRDGRQRPGELSSRGDRLSSEVNEFGRNIKVHGLNLSLGYPFLPRWFAAGQSPLCVEVDRLARSGVVVVVAAGNARLWPDHRRRTASRNPRRMRGRSPIPAMRIAITVGSAHRDMPHTYGVSYFSAKGPTADGRMKPDLVAPGERIVSCARMADGRRRPGRDPVPARIREPAWPRRTCPARSPPFCPCATNSSARPRPSRIFSAPTPPTSSGKTEFQGAGLIDVLRTLQAV